eukprot:TRINITY_DN512_c0_g1_i1.p1 TRINITY_DN512_c0_g1~~TRINITY_DN512_c0_g1_i1.p1  ORF type:complete len:176 (-),score=32.91 TRINITY_DN512_c0_g1_i1:160-687(-)
MVVLNLDKEFGYVLLTVVFQAFEVLIIGFAVPGRARSKVFNKNFLEVHFGDEHRREFGVPPPRGGYPDMGTGRYSDKLPYAEWVYFNKAQRVHYNLIEQAASIMVFTLIGGLQYPIAATVLGALFIIGRIFFCAYLLPKGSEDILRSIGALLGDVSLLGTFGISVAAGLKICEVF